MQQTDVPQENSSGFLNYLPTILWQRRWFVIIPVLLLSAAGLLAAILLPTVYRSSATLLVEAQELPTSVATTPQASEVDQRIAKIRQQVLSRGDLIALIEQNDLYGQERTSAPLSATVETMRESTSVEPVPASVGQSGGGADTIAFLMSFEYRDPIKAQAVMQSFVNRFLQIDNATRSDQATGTVAFLEEQASNLQRQLATLERRITSIKAANGLALSSVGTPNFSDTGSYDAQIATLQNQNRALQFQLQIQSRRTPPDSQVAAAEAQLAAARAIYAETHPDVLLAKQRLAQARQSSVPENDTRDLNADAIRGQMEANNNTIASLTRSRASDSARSAASLATQSRAPVIMEQVIQLDNRANLLRQQYEEVSTNLLNARSSARMAQEQRGERLSVLDPPVVPDRPVSPNRPLLIAGGVAAGLALGIVLALVVEAVLRPIRGVGMVEDLGLEPLGVVPTLRHEGPKKKWLRSRNSGGPVQRPDPA